MQPISHSIWWPRLAAFVLAGLAAGSAAYWALRLPSRDLAVAAPTAVTDTAPTDPLALARALGGGDAPVATAKTSPVVVNTSSRLALLGVVANTKSGGAALISVDGKPARPFAVGARVDDNLVLQSVAPRRAVLASSTGDPANLTLELPPLSK
jgi:general secretion pathway protein C